MPTENRSSSNHGTRTFTLDSLTTALEQVQALHEISADLIAESVFGQPAQQGQREPINLDALRCTGFSQVASGWNKCIDRLQDQFGQLYPHADHAEVERLRAMVEIAESEALSATVERDDLHEQLAEAHALLREIADHCNGCVMPTEQLLRDWGSSIDAALSASAERSAPKCDGNHGGGQCQDPECWNGGEPSASAALLLGIQGKAFDQPGTHRAYTYTEQPGNDEAYRLGQAVANAKPGGDAIDHGLSLLQQLQAAGFGVFDINAVERKPIPPKKPTEPAIRRVVNEKVINSDDIWRKP